MTSNILPQTTPTVPTFLTWADDGSLQLVQHPQILCPACETYCGALIQGVCLGCLIEWDEQIAPAEARYDAEASAETVCSCGLD